MGAEGKSVQRLVFNVVRMVHGYVRRLCRGVSFE